MDSLLVDLDKVLDDFEAEETLAPGRERTPSGYQQYLEKNSGDLSAWAPADNLGPSSAGPRFNPDPNTPRYNNDNLGNVSDKASTSVRYDFPYEPENFDLSEADFAPSPNLGKAAFNGTLEYNSDKTNGNVAEVGAEQSYNGNVNGFSDHSAGINKEPEVSKEMLVEKVPAKNNIETAKMSFPIEADLSPHKEPYGELQKNGHDRSEGLANLEMPTTYIASVPSLSSIESNSEYNKYPVQCNTPQTPKDNPMENPLNTQIMLSSDPKSQDATLAYTTGALTASQTSMQDIPKLQNLKDDLEAAPPQTNGNAGHSESFAQHQQFGRPSQSLPASFHGDVTEKTNTSLPTDLSKVYNSEAANINSVPMASDTSHTRAMDGESIPCDNGMRDTQPNLASEKQAEPSVVGFCNADVDDDMDDKDLDNYLAEDAANQYLQQPESGYVRNDISGVTVDTKMYNAEPRMNNREYCKDLTDPCTAYMDQSDPYSKSAALSDTQYGVNLLQNVKNTNSEVKPMVVDNVGMKVGPGDIPAFTQGAPMAPHSGLEVLKVLPVVGQDGIAQFPSQTATPPSVISQPDTNLSPSANMSIDSGCASMTDNQMDSMAASLQTSDNNTVADNGGARPKDTNSRINRPSSLRGLSTVNLNSDSPFVMKPAVCPSDASGERDGSGTTDNPPPYQESVVNRTNEMVVVDDSRQLMEVDNSDNTFSVANVASSDVMDNTTVTQSQQSQMRQEHDSQDYPRDNTNTGYIDPADIDTGEGYIDPADVDTGDVEMRRGSGTFDGDHAERPRSWSPADSGQPHLPKQKRPTSLNLPPPPSYNLDNGRSQMEGEEQTGATGGAVEEQEFTAEEAQDLTADDTVTGAECQESMMPAVDDAPLELPPSGAGAEALPPDLGPPPPYSTSLGMVAPRWVPDAEAPACMSCDVRFTFTKRRHHCRACGKVFCSSCCSMKNRLPYMKHQEARVCVICHSELVMAEQGLIPGAGGMGPGPHPNHPGDYCSVIPPAQTVPGATISPPPSVLVPVLKRDGNAGSSADGSARRSGEPKQVMFSDGIRPGGDLTELDGSSEVQRLPPRRSRQQKRVERVSQGGQHSPRSRRLRTVTDRTCKCLIPEEGLPPIAVPQEEGNEHDLQLNPDPEVFMPKIKDEESSPVIFALNTNLQVLVKIVNLECCVNRVVWCFSTRGMASVGQEEIVIVLETLPDETTVPRDIFTHLHMLYEDASKGNVVTDMGHTIFNQSHLGSRDHGGYLYIRATFQCVQKLVLPEPPFLYGILLQKWETPWAKVFPLRLLLRLGAEYRYYPCPLIGVRNRKPVFFEIGHTIMNLLADFRNFQYMLPSIRGVTIHMEDKLTKINFPTNRYDDLMKVVSNSNEHVMAVSATFSADADSHLVCIQNDDGNYQTQAINIQNKPRKVTGASFVVFNGALKSSSGLSAKSSIVEDGLMVQISPDSMIALKQAVKDMVSYTIQCGVTGAPKPDETVIVQWVDDDKNVNIGVKSPIDGLSLDGIDSLHVHNSTDYVGDKHLIRWTQIFFLLPFYVKSPIDGLSLDGIESLHVHNSTDYVGDKHLIRWTQIFFLRRDDAERSVRWEHVDLSRLGETVATATCVAMTPHLDRLRQAGLNKIGLRVKLGADDVGYEAGALGKRLPDVYMNDLDNELIPVIHRATQQDGHIVLELIFHVLD